MILKFKEAKLSGRVINMPFIGNTQIDSENSFEVEDEKGEQLLKALAGTQSEVEKVEELEESLIDQINKMSKKELQDYVEEAGLELPDNLKKVAEIREHVIKLIS